MSGPDFKGGPYIHDNRNWLVHRFLKTDADSLLFIDDDVTWDEKAVVELYESKLLVCGGAYPKKEDIENYPIEPLGADPFDHAYRECLYLPGGFLMIRREVLENMQSLVDSCHNAAFNEPVAEFFQCVTKPQKMGEDISFCYRWREMGGKVWCLTDIDFGHQGPKEWRGNLAKFLPPLYEVKTA